MSWTVVQGKGRGRKGASGVGASLAAMQNSFTQLAQAIGQTLTPQGKGQGKGIGQGPGERQCETSPGARKGRKFETSLRKSQSDCRGGQLASNAKPTIGRAVVCAVHVATALPQGNKTITPPPHSHLARPLTKCWGCPSSSSVASSGLSYAAVTKGATGQADPKKDDKTVLAQKADKLEHLLATLDETDPLREDLQPQLDQLRKDLRDPRQPGARLDSAVAKQKKAEAKVARCEEALRQAEDSLRLAREERAAADSELKAAREAAAPAPAPPTLPQGDAGLRLSSEDMVGLTDMLKQCGLLAVAAQEAQEQQELGEGTGKRPRVGPYGAAEAKSPREIAQLANPALVNKLAASVAYIQRHMQPPGGENVGAGSSTQETQVASASEVAAQLDFQKAQGLTDVAATLRDTPSQGGSQQEDAQM